MTKENFLIKLKNQLKKLPENEREEVYAYYDEYLNEAENLEEVIKTLQPPALIVKNIKKEISSSEEFDLGTYSIVAKNDISIEQCNSAKKQLIFLTIYSILALIVYDVFAYLTPEFSLKNDLTVLTLYVFFPVFFLILLALKFKNGRFEPLKKGFQRYFIIRYLLPQFVIFLILYNSQIIFSMSGFMLHNFPQETLIEYLILSQLYHYSMLGLPFHLYFLIAFLVILPLNYLVNKGNKYIKILIKFITGALAIGMFLLVLELSTATF